MFSATTGEMIGFLFFVALVGGLLGVGCEHGCGYVKNHVSVKVK